MRAWLRTGTRIAALVAAMSLPASPSVAAEAFGVRTYTGLPQSSVAQGQALAWRNVGVVAESGPVTGELAMANCVTSAGRLVPSTCGDAADGAGSLGYRAAVTFALPQPVDGGPRVDVALRTWSTSVGRANPGERSSGTAAEIAVTQAIGAFDVYAGASTPATLAAQAGRARATFAGVAWYPQAGTHLELVADRSEDAASGTTDRALTLRIVQSVARGLRATAWATRTPDDPASGWQAGAGVEFSF